MASLCEPFLCYCLFLTNLISAESESSHLIRLSGNNKVIGLSDKTEKLAFPMHRSPDIRAIISSFWISASVSRCVAGTLKLSCSRRTRSSWMSGFPLSWLPPLLRTSHWTEQTRQVPAGSLTNTWKCSVSPSAPLSVLLPLKSHIVSVCSIFSCLWEVIGGALVPEQQICRRQIQIQLRQARHQKAPKV